MKKVRKIFIPQALFDSLEHIDFNYNNVISNIKYHLKINCDLTINKDSELILSKFFNLNTQYNFHVKDFERTLEFLKCYTGSKGTFNSYRRDIERLLHWSWNICEKTLSELTREDIEKFINFCKKPPKSWIGIKKVPKFIENKGKRIPNFNWKPFVVTVSKIENKKGIKPNKEDFDLSEGAIKELFAILSSFFNYLIQEEYLSKNVITLIRQKSKFIRKKQDQFKIRRLSNLQWGYVIETTEKMAKDNPQLHERSLFILSALYLMYLRISELAANDRWLPTMNDFHRSHDDCWWFNTVGKGNKERQIAVSDSMLQALKRWRKFLKLSPLPTAKDNSPLLPKVRGKGPISSTTYIRDIVQMCFDNASYQLKKDGYNEEAQALMEATVHWLRHTGISNDIKIRPRDHVRIDAGHSSSITTDKYIDIELKERHASAKNKKISEEISN